MWYLGRGIPGIVMRHILIFVAHCPEVSSQEPEDRALDAANEEQKVDVGGTDSQKMSKMLLKTKRALRAIQNRAAGDPTFKQLADRPIHRREYAKSFELGISCADGWSDRDPDEGRQGLGENPGEVGISIKLLRKSDWCGS